MRLGFGSAALPLVLLAGTSALAQTTVSDSRTTALATSTTGDLTITSAGGVTVTGTTPAVTLDSDNAVSNGGTISIKDVDGATGVLVVGGHSGSVLNSGAITVTESYTASDSTNADSITEAPYASGSGRFGLRLAGPGAFTGALTNTGSITVQGDSSYGMSLETLLAGDLVSSGTLSLTGDNGAALRELAGVSGAVSLSGSVAAKGTGSRAVDLEGDLGGRLSISGSISSTGYATAIRPTTAASLTAIQGTPADLQQGGSAVVIGGSVGGGVLISAPPTGTVSGTTADVDGDGVADTSEGTGTINSFGSAPAMVIGATGRATTLGAVGGTDLENVVQPANAYGLINRGTTRAPASTTG